MDSLQTGFAQNSRRKVLTAAVSAMVYEAGFAYADRMSLETLIEMFQGLVMEVGRASRAAAELAGRTEVIVPDVVFALVEMGINVDSIPEFGYNQIRAGSSKIVIPAPGFAAKQSVPKILSAGDKRPHSTHIPDHLPPFPDPHSYIRTPTHKQPVTEYEAIREKSASQKRDVERALSRFVAKTSESSLSHSLFPDDMLSHLFPLIPLKTNARTYLTSLLPKDQVFDEDEEEEVKATEETKEETTATEEPNTEDSNNKPSEAEVPDNPFLRSPKIIKKRRM